MGNLNDRNYVEKLEERIKKLERLALTPDRQRRRTDDRREFNERLTSQLGNFQNQLRGQKQIELKRDAVIRNRPSIIDGVDNVFSLYFNSADEVRYNYLYLGFDGGNQTPPNGTSKTGYVGIGANIDTSLPVDGTLENLNAVNISLASDSSLEPFAGLNIQDSRVLEFQAGIEQTYGVTSGLYSWGPNSSSAVVYTRDNGIPLYALGVSADGVEGVEYNANGSIASSVDLMKVAYGGNVKSDGTERSLPTGWTSSKASTGTYEITHNLGVDNAATVSARNLDLLQISVVPNSNTLTVLIQDDNGSYIDKDFSFVLSTV